ncbi:acetylornithine deacetylase [Thiohalobacter thiocyanaticus]|uniref:Acetylornithine deacetylase n=1 Tax=Thiohalobacter thiocyanaticus TaxID=585455 RepID=A0A1Z4VP75_9GAMM|nr:acetylornithine deacetylase [Thiohalobacter thiocyanaticus]BAZ93222.1 acetylornithine deacetylase [Thiohalobacter thiocyanaticus]
MHTSPPDLMDMLTALIGTPSISSVNPDFDQGNRRVVELLASWLDDLGFAVEVQSLPGHADKANLIARLGTGEGGLVLAGHTDTVPCDPELWTHDPFRLTEADNRLYGLGTSDMKSFLGLAVEAARELHTRTLKEPLYIVATADEESSMLGARTLVECGRPRARHAIIGEPTGLRPIRTHKGILMEAIRLRGRSGHSSDPALGVNALEGMHRVLGEILGWREDLQAKYRNPLFKVPVPTLNLGHIHGGDNPNRICGECELHIDLRPLPGMNLDDLRTELRSRLERLLADSPLKLDVIPLFEGTPAMETPADAPIVQLAERLTGAPAEAVAFGTEGPYFNQLGTQTVILGPGDIDQAHQPDEYLGLERIAPTLDLLEQFIISCCLAPAR